MFLLEIMFNFFNSLFAIKIDDHNDKYHSKGSIYYSFTHLRVLHTVHSLIHTTPAE